MGSNQRGGSCCFKLARNVGFRQAKMKLGKRGRPPSNAPKFGRAGKTAEIDNRKAHSIPSIKLLLSPGKGQPGFLYNLEPKVLTIAGGSTTESRLRKVVSSKGKGLGVL